MGAVRTLGTGETVEMVYIANSISIPFAKINLLGEGGATTVSGWLLTDLGVMTGVSFTGAVPNGDGATASVSIAALYLASAGTPIPKDAGAVVLRFGQGPDILWASIDTSYQVGLDDFKVNCARFGKVSSSEFFVPFGRK